MTEEQTIEHFDETKHVRFTQPFPGFYRCDECHEINVGWYEAQRAQREIAEGRV